MEMHNINLKHLKCYISYNIQNETSINEGKANPSSDTAYNNTRRDHKAYDSGLSGEEECKGKGIGQWAARDSIVTDVLVEAIFICGR